MTSGIARALTEPLTLPCGVVLKNRIAKSAMSDSLGDGRGNPTEPQIRLYERWARGGAALTIVGEAQAGPDFPERPGNLVLGESSDATLFRRLAERGAQHGAQIWLQLGHAGALAYPPISAPEGPSALDIDGLSCAEMSLDAIRALPERFPRAAVSAKELGFGGVQLHAAHGFLLSQFLSPLFNRRQDAYGGSIETRCRIVVDIIERVRAAVGPGFPIGLKLNATDQIEGGLGEPEALDVLRILNETPLDLVDISGGAYFPGAKAASDSGGRGPYFLDFAARARAVFDKPLMTTGGFKTRDQAVEAVASGATDMVGLARAFVLEPDLPSIWLSEEGGDPAFPRFRETPPGGMTAWYTMRIAALAEGREEALSMTPAEALAAFEARDADRVPLWRERFGGAPRG